jgi:hypothetical protein
VSRTDARLARFYGFDVAALPPGRKLGYLCHHPALEAEEMLREHGGDLSADVLYDVMLRATGSERAAQDAFNARRLEELKRAGGSG